MSSVCALSCSFCVDEQTEILTDFGVSLQEMGLCPYPPPAVASWSPCNETFCLFNVSADPCEHKNLAEEMPEVVERMTTRLKAFQVRKKKHTTELSRRSQKGSCRC